MRLWQRRWLVRGSRSSWPDRNTATLPLHPGICGQPVPTVPAGGKATGQCPKLRQNLRGRISIPQGGGAAPPGRIDVVIDGLLYKTVAGACFCTAEVFVHSLEVCFRDCQATFYSFCVNEFQSKKMKAGVKKSCWDVRIRVEEVSLLQDLQKVHKQMVQKRRKNVRC